MSIEHDEVVRRIDSAYISMIRADFVLFEIDVNERSLTHKLAEHLQVEFQDWNVDCEYNRNGSLPKRLKSSGDSVSTDDTEGKTVFPDIIVHHRQSKDNFVVIEAKKSSTVSTSEDKAKLRDYVSEHGYQFAFMVVFPVGLRASNADPSIDITEVVA
jgi:hypothetical protein